MTTLNSTNTFTNYLNSLGIILILFENLNINYNHFQLNQETQAIRKTELT